VTSVAAKKAMLRAMGKQSVFLIFPHQLFEVTTALEKADKIYLVEEYLYFNQYKFHKQKLVFHRASMQAYAAFLKEKQLQLEYINATEPTHDIRALLADLQQQGVSQIQYYDVCDHLLEKRIQLSCEQHQLSVLKLESPLYINNSAEIASYFGTKSKYFHTDFYIKQRKKLKLLLDTSGNALGGKWSLDAENRLKYPKGKAVPTVQFPSSSVYYQAAIAYVEKHFAENYGIISNTFIYPTTHQESKVWLTQFLEKRLQEFGAYEDAIVGDETLLHHGLLTPMLNVGLLTPQQIVTAAIAHSLSHTVPLNSLEGFIRQIIGWREFIRGVYVHQGSYERKRNYWQFHRKIPHSFYDGTTGIAPIDTTIRKVLATGYCHHIERLMLLGNFMLLCEFDPDEVYKWFMEMFIDAYDWVMVPNVYGMSQFADGGLMATKPYISGSSYVLKMSDFKKGPWCAQWDALFWHFMHTQRDFFLSNPRLGMLIKVFDKMDDKKKNEHLLLAKNWLERIE